MRRFGHLLLLAAVLAAFFVACLLVSDGHSAATATILAAVYLGVEEALRPARRRQKERHDALQRQIGWGYGYGAGYNDGRRGVYLPGSIPDDGRARRGRAPYARPAHAEEINPTPDDVLPPG